MCKTVLAVTGTSTLALFVGAAGVSAATTDETPWYELLLWIGAGISGALLLVAVLMCASILAWKHLTAIQIKDNWSCTYWTKEQQIKVTVWFEDRLYAAQYRTECIAEVGHASISLDDDVELGGMYFGKRGLISGHSGPVMAEFRKDDVALDTPESATIHLSIQPRNPWGAAKKETKTIPIEIVSHDTDEAVRGIPAPSTEEQ